MRNALRAALFADGTVFVLAALFNLGLALPLGLAELDFPVPIWQAGIGEAVIGSALLVAAVTGRAAVAWVAFAMSVGGIAFGLASPRVEGPARDIHILLIPMALIVFALLLWQGWVDRRRRSESPAETGTGSQVARTAWQPISIAICGLMALATVAFVVASVIHFGVTVPLGVVTIADSFRGAALPEAIIAIVLAVGTVTVMARWPPRWPVALGTTLFAFLLTIYGLTITLGLARTGDIIYHVSVLVVLAVIAGLLLLPPGRRSLSG